MEILLLIILLIIATLTWVGSTVKSKVKGFHSSQFAQLTSDYKYSAFTSPKDNPRSLTLISEGNQIDDLGYLIYKDYADKLDEADILIRDNNSQEMMKIVKDGNSESMIGVNHPEKGHIGYLQFEIVS